MRSLESPLPIDEALPALAAALAAGSAAVLVAPPGAGKTTRVPLALLDEPWACGGRILVLEPRRLAARAAAARMAATLDESVGETVGLRVRFGSQVSRATRIEVITEGIFTRMILDDPALDGIAAVLFDEFHERSLDADLGLALARDAQQGLREDLRLVAMSATLDAARVAHVLGGAPVIESRGRAFAVETRYAGRDPRERIEIQMAEAIARALRAEPGSVLAFLPGAAEIRRTAEALAERIDDPAVDIVSLHGTLDAATQDQAIAPAAAGRRKVVLATAIAETSLTIEGVRIVVDSGLARVPRYEPDVGLTRLESVRVSRAAADQRRGRAGRTEPGVCYRLWDEPQTAALEAHARPEILNADLAGFALDVAAWGAPVEQLRFLDAPPRAALAEARGLLTELAALDADGRLTDTGRRLRRLPLPPRLARMVIAAADAGAGLAAAQVAAILSERGLGGNDLDLTHRAEHLRRDRSARAAEARAMARRWVEAAAAGALRGQPEAGLSVGALLALAYPDRIARNRGSGGVFLLANGRAGLLDPASALAREPFVVVGELAGAAAQARIVLAAPIALAELEAVLADRIVTRDEIVFDTAAAAVRGRSVRRLGAVTLAERPLRVAAGAEAARVLAEGLATAGVGRLPWTPALRQCRDRVAFLREAEGEPWPDLSDAALAADAGWLGALVQGSTAVADIGADALEAALRAALPPALQRRLDRDAPTHFTAPTGSRAAIDYAAEEGPKVAIRVQELFGLDRHPAIAAGRVALVVALLSPAQRPVQVTRDLPGFWRGSYQAVKAEMKGRYPRHPWPDDPLAAPATRRAKPRTR